MDPAKQLGCVSRIIISLKPEASEEDIPVNCNIRMVCMKTR